MQKFTLRQNIAHFNRLLVAEPNRKARGILREMIQAAQRELACLESQAVGIGVGRSSPGTAASRASRAGHIARALRTLGENLTSPLLILDPRPGLRIVDVNFAYANATMTVAARVTGERMFDIFPDNPDDPSADGVCNLYNSLQMATTTRRDHAMLVQRYDVRDADGNFVEKHWQPRNVPILDETGSVIFLLHRVEDVTARISAARAAKPAPDPAFQRRKLS